MVLGLVQWTRCFCWLLGISSQLRACSVITRVPSQPGIGQGGQEGSRTLPSLQGPLLRWLKVNFSEAFIAWIHIKALRVFVESVLRWVEMPTRLSCSGDAGRSQRWDSLSSCLPLPALPLQPPQDMPQLSALSRCSFWLLATCLGFPK